MARSVSATAGTPKGLYCDLHRTNGMPFSEASETENSIVSAGSKRALSLRTIDHPEAEGPASGPPLSSAPGHLRASHADREQVTGMLEAAFAAGLLTKAELDVGMRRVLASRTHADLAAAAAAL